MAAEATLKHPLLTSHTRGYAGLKFGETKSIWCDFGNYLLRCFGRYFARSALRPLCLSRASAPKNSESEPSCHVRFRTSFGIPNTRFYRTSKRAKSFSKLHRFLCLMDAAATTGSRELVPVKFWVPWVKRCFFLVSGCLCV